jgi:hypothetical protein
MGFSMSGAGHKMLYMLPPAPLVSKHARLPISLQEMREEV